MQPTQMASCAVYFIPKLSSKVMKNTSTVLNFMEIDDQTSETRSSTCRVQMLVDSGIALKTSCCSEQITSTAESIKIHHIVCMSEGMNFLGNNKGT